MTGKTKWNYYNPVKICFGSNRLKELPSLIGDAEGILFITTAGFTSRGVTATVCKMLEGKQVTVLDNVEPNPDLDYFEKEFAGLSGKANH